ncbi:MAG: hypothetical protein OCC49_03255 [Fibrobacterales bacterium]
MRITIMTLILFAQLALANPIDYYRGEKSQAMGQTGVASLSGHHSLSLNPALLANYTSWNVDLFSTIGVNGVLVDYADWLVDNSSNISDFDTLMTKLDPIDNKWAPFLVHGGLGVQIKQFALNFTWNTYTRVAMTKAPITPVLGVGARTNFKLISGYGLEINPGLSLGVALYGKYSIIYKDRYLGTTSEDFWTVYNTMNSDDKSTWSKITVAEEIADTKMNFGGNIGVTKEIGSYMTTAFSLIDIGESASPNLAFNAHYQLGKSDTFHTLFDGNIDWQQMFISDHIYQQFKLGTSASLSNGNRRVGYIAAGLNDGYPTFGIQAGYGFYVTYTYFTQETGTYPGQRPLTFHKLTLEIGI